MKVKLYTTYKLVLVRIPSGADRSGILGFSFVQAFTYIPLQMLKVTLKAAGLLYKNKATFGISKENRLFLYAGLNTFP